MKISKRVLLGGSVAALCGCGSRSPRGGKAASAARIVSLSPSTTETLFAIGAGGLTVGRSRYCDFPAAALALPVVGGFVDASLEAILGLAPTLVVGARGPGGSSVKDALEARGIATYFPETESVAQIEEMIRGVGQRCAHEEGAAALLARMARERAHLAARVATGVGARPRVLLLFGLSPIVGAGALGYPDEMLTLSGCDNALRGPHLPRAAYPTLSLEQVLVADPDVVLLTAAMGETPSLPSLFAPLRALHEGRVATVPGDAILRPGPRLGEGLGAIVRAVFPGLLSAAEGPPGPSRPAASTP